MPACCAIVCPVLCAGPEFTGDGVVKPRDFAGCTECELNRSWFILLIGNEINFFLSVFPVVPGHMIRLFSCFIKWLKIFGYTQVIKSCSLVRSLNDASFSFLPGEELTACGIFYHTSFA